MVLDPEASKQRRAANRENSAQLLREHGVPFVSKNSGAHLVIDGGWADFWPGTGLWIIRITKQRERGVFPLIRAWRRL